MVHTYMRKKALATVTVLLFLISTLIIMMPASSAEDENGLPSSFDQRDLRIVTPPKRQNPWGTCWAFGGTGAAETAILTAMGMTYEETGLDLSERHVAYFSETPVYDPVTYSQQGEGLHSKSDDPNAPFNNGGTAYYFAQLFSTGAGPIFEEMFPYHGENGLSYSQLYQDHDRAAEIVNKDYKAMKEILPTYTPEEREIVFNRLVSQGLVFPEGVTAANFTFDDFVEAVISADAKRYAEKDDYAEYDDWYLDIYDRNYSTGYTMMDGNRIGSTRLLDDGGNWIGVDWDRTNDVKNELYMGHGLVLSYHYDANGYDNDLGTQYGIWTNSNHCVQIVGWNDSISKDDFACSIGGDVYTPEGNGAWLCKNSWGSETYGYDVNGITYYTDWGIKDAEGKHTGFFWLSYYDRSIWRIESLSFSDGLLNNEEFLYYVYDYLPDVKNNHLLSSEPLAMANVFKSYEHSKIQAVSICTREFDSDANVKIYRNPRYGDPESGELVFETDVSYHIPGIHVLYLGDGVNIFPQQRFSVVMEERTQDGRYVVGANMANDEEHSGGSKTYGVSVINRGESYLCSEGRWHDLADDTAFFESRFPGTAVDNFSIKVFAVHRPNEDPGAPYTIAIAAMMVIPALAILSLRRH